VDLGQGVGNQEVRGGEISEQARRDLPGVVRRVARDDPPNPADAPSRRLRGGFEPSLLQ
jgi:hypothetical protein